MDIAFTCGNCRKNLVVDEAGAGITIDCPECGKPVYVPTAVPQASPARVAVKTTTQRGVTHNPPVFSPSTQLKFSVHPSIESGVHCLLILVVIQFVGFGLIRQNLLWSGIFMAADMPFVAAPLLCAVYGMCIGHVRQGVLILAALAFILGGSYWLMFRPVVQPSSADIQRQMEEMQKQMQRMFK